MLSTRLCMLWLSYSDTLKNIRFVVCLLSFLSPEIIDRLQSSLEIEESVTSFHSGFKARH